MARQRKPRRRSATTDEGRESQLVTLAIDLAEKQLIDGTASSQTITHFLKMGSTREKLERERLIGENEVLRAKVGAMESAQRVEELYAKAFDAFRGYAGLPSPEEDDYDDEML